MGNTVHILIDTSDGHGSSSTSLRLEASSEMMPRALRPNLDRAKSAPDFASETGKPATADGFEAQTIETVHLRLAATRPRWCWHVSDLPPCLDAFESFARTCRTGRLVDSPSSLATRSKSPHPSFMLPCRSVHHVGHPWLCPASSGPLAQVYSHSSPNLSLGLHLAPSTAASHPAPALHNQGKHQHATIVNHSSHRDDHHWSSISPLMSALTTLRTNLIVWKLNQKMKRTSPERSRSQVKSQKRSGRSKISIPRDKGNGSTRLRQEITWSLKKRQRGLNTNHVTR